MSNTIFLRALRRQPKSVQRIYSLMRKGTWKHSSDIKNSAGEHLTDGLRRMRDLRGLLKTVGRDIEKERVTGTNQFRYRIIG